MAIKIDVRNYVNRDRTKDYLSYLDEPKNKSKKLTQEEFDKKVFDLVGKEYTFLEKYDGKYEKLLVRHNKEECNYHTYKVMAGSFLYKNARCPICKNLKRRLTTEDFIKKLEELYPNKYDVKGSYIDGKTKVLIKCKDCGLERMVIPDEIKKGRNGCPGCTFKKMTPDEYREMIKKETNGEYLPVGDFENYETKLLMKHLPCGKEYIVLPQTFKHGRGRCPKCVRYESRKGVPSKRKITQEEFENRIKDVYGDEFSSVGKYEDWKKHTPIKHNTCGTVWNPIAGDFLRKDAKCPYCMRLPKYTGLEIQKRLDKKYGDNVYKVLTDKIQTIDTTIKVKHICGNEFNTSADVLLRKDVKIGCIICAGKNTKTIEEFRKEVLDLYSGEYDLAEDAEYINNSTPIKLIHKKCGNYFYGIPYSVKAGHLCPYCNFSRGEVIIESYLKGHNINYKPQFSFPDCIDKRPLKFDFAIFDKWDKLCCLIEFQGEQHFIYIKQFKESLEDRQKRDKIKQNYCIENMIPLFVFSYIDFNKKTLNNKLDEAFIPLLRFLVKEEKQ